MTRYRNFWSSDSPEPGDPVFIEWCCAHGHDEVRWLGQEADARCWFCGTDHAGEMADRRRVIIDRQEILRMILSHRR